MDVIFISTDKAKYKVLTYPNPNIGYGAIVHKLQDKNRPEGMDNPARNTGQRIPVYNKSTDEEIRKALVQMEMEN